MLIAVLLGSFAQAVFAAESQYNVQMHIIRGPIRPTNTLFDAAFDEWSTNMAWKFYQNRTLADEDVGYRLRVEDVTQPAQNRTNHTLWAAIRITGRNGAKISLPRSRSVMNSTDSANIFENVYSPSDTTNLVYSRRAPGVIWGPGGERTSDIILMNNDDGNIIVDEVVFIGAQVKYYPYTSQTDYDNFEGYMLGFITGNGLELRIKWEVLGESGEVLAVAYRTLQMLNSPIQPILSIRLEPDLSVVGINMESGRTATLESRMSLSDPWTMVGTINAGDERRFSRQTPTQRFFRAILQ